MRLIFANRHTTIVAVFIGLAMSSCASAPTGMTSKSINEDGQWQTEDYSKYFEFEQSTNDGSVLSRLIVTLGPERVPDGVEVKARHYANLREAYRDGLVEWVSEIYFINNGSSEVQVTPISIQVAGRTLDFGDTLTIPSGERQITAPLIHIGGSFATEVPVEYSYSYGGRRYDVEGVAERLTTKELKSKYGRK